jgi:adenylate cyclase
VIPDPGTLNHYAGDAMFAVWEADRFPHAAELAIDFALAADRRVDELGRELPLRAPDGSPIRMGWGVVVGTAALAAMTRSVEAVIGDSTNVAFRLSGLAGRDGRAAVMVTSDLRRLVETQFTWGEGEKVEIKGRRGVETVFPVVGRETRGTASPHKPDNFARRANPDTEGNRDPTTEIPLRDSN